MSERVCLGYGEKEGKCQDKAGTPWTPYWCDECDRLRRETIAKQMEGMIDRFERPLGGGEG